MIRRRLLLGGVGALALALATETGALAAPPNTAPAAGQAAAKDAHGPRASLDLEVAKPKAWVGQAVSVTLRATFRGVDGVTLEGAPTLTSPGIFTSDLAPKPRQATQIIAGVPVLVATWSGTVTPSAAAPLTLAAELPVSLRYREAAPRVELQRPQDEDEDPFEALARNPFDTSAIDRFFQRSMGQALGRVRQQATTLRASARVLEVEPLPTAGQPPSFSGAIGRFDLGASISSTRAAASEPLTLKVVVEPHGSGDLDRVDVVGVPSSEAWKAYPAKATVEPAAKGKPARKVFEQVLVPLHGGELTVPEVSLTSFDPDSGQYVTRQTATILVSVDGPATVVAAPPSAAASNAPAGPIIGPVTSAAPAPVKLPPVVRPLEVALRVAPAALFAFAAGLFVLLRKRRAGQALRRAMRRAAGRGDLVSFYRAAHALIEEQLAARWGVAPLDVKAATIRARLGADGEPLAEAIATDEALRFGRGSLEHADLVPLCSSIERSLGGAS